MLKLYSFNLFVKSVVSIPKINKYSKTLELFNTTRLGRFFAIFIIIRIPIFNSFKHIVDSS